MAAKTKAQDIIDNNAVGEWGQLFSALLSHR